MLNNRWLYMSPDAEGGEGGGEEAPTPISLTDDTLVAFGEDSEPVKWSDYQKKLESEYVPKSELTRMRQQDSEKVQRQAMELARQYAQQFQQQRPQQPQAGTPSGANLPPQVQQILNQIRQRDGYVDADSFQEAFAVAMQQMQGSTQQMAQVRQAFEGYLKSQAEDQQAQKIARQIEGLQKKYPLLFDGDEGRDLADAIYHGKQYDGDPSEYPQYIEGWLEKMQKKLIEAVQKMQKQKAEEARKSAVPGGGGNFTPKSEGGRPEGYEEWAERAFSEMMGGNRPA